MDNALRGKDADSLIQMAIDFFSVADFDHKDEELLILHLVDDAVVLSRPDINAIELLFRFEFLDAVRARVVPQFLYVRNHLAAYEWIQFFQVAERGWTKLYVVAQLAAVLSAQLLLDHIERDVFSGFRQSGAGIFEVPAVHFLTGQTL